MNEFKISQALWNVSLNPWKVGTWDCKHILGISIDFRPLTSGHGSLHLLINQWLAKKQINRHGFTELWDFSPTPVINLRENRGGGGCLVSDSPQPFSTLWALWKYPSSQKENTSQLFLLQPSHSCDTSSSTGAGPQLNRAPDESLNQLFL